MRTAYAERRMSTSVIVVGAGPAGTAAAIELRRNGHTVTIIDKASFPRDKCCGDGLTASALRHLEELGLRPESIPSWKQVRDVWIHRPSGAAMAFPLPRGQGQFAATARRIELDAALVDLARSHGAVIDEGVALTGIDLHEGRVVVQTDHGPREADWCIAADGMWSPTRKALGLGGASETGGPYLGEWHAFRQYYTNVSERAAQDLFVWFEPDLLPGYAWSFPLPDGRANIGFGVMRGKHRTRDMAEIWRGLLDRPHIRQVLGPDAVPEAPHRAWPIPARVGELALSAHRVLFVGDAAAACDPMTGEGIGQALQTGISAAHCIAGGPDAAATAPAAIAAAYEEATERHLAIDMRLAATLGGVLGTERGAEWSLATAGMTGWTSRNFARWLFEDYPRAVLGTPRRWRSDLFTKPGAFS